MFELIPIGVVNNGDLANSIYYMTWNNRNLEPLF